MYRNQTFGQALRELRLVQGWTQCRLASEVKVTQASVSNWETGKCLPSGRELGRLCQYDRRLLHAYSQAMMGGDDG